VPGWQSGIALASRASGPLAHRGSNPFPGAILLVNLICLVAFEVDVLSKKLRVP
jgi:hypothetical protein